MEFGDKIKVYKNYMGLKSERFQEVERVEDNQVWVTDYKFPFSLETGDYSQMSIKGFKIYIKVKKQ